MDGMLAMSDEPRLPSAIAGLENFSLSRDDEKPARDEDLDADSFFNLPDADEDDEDDN